MENRKQWALAIVVLAITCWSLVPIAIHFKLSGWRMRFLVGALGTFTAIAFTWLLRAVWGPVSGYDATTLIPMIGTVLVAAWIATLVGNNTKAEHVATIEKIEGEHTKAIEKIEGEHAKATADLKVEHTKAIEKIEGEHAKAIEKLDAAALALKAEHAKATGDLKAEHAKATGDLKAEHAKAIEKLDAAALALKAEHAKTIDGRDKDIDEKRRDISAKDRILVAHDAEQRVNDAERKLARAGEEAQNKSALEAAIRLSADKARTDGGNEAIAKLRAAEDAADAARPLKEFMDVRLWVETQEYSRRPDPSAMGATIRAGHRAMYRRGPSENTVSLRCGIEIASHGKQCVHARYIRDLNIEISWPGGIAIINDERTRKPMILDFPIEFPIKTTDPTSHVHIHTIDEPNIRPYGSHIEPSIDKRFGTVRVMGTVALEGDKRTLVFDVTAPIPFEIGSMPDFEKATESIRKKLRAAGAKRVDAIDLDLQHGTELFWRWAAQSEAQVPDRSVETAYREPMLDRVVECILGDIKKHEPGSEDPSK